MEKCLYRLLVYVIRSIYAKLAHLDFVNKKGPVKLIKRVKIAHSFSQFV